MKIRKFQSTDKEGIQSLFEEFGSYFVEIDDLKLTIKRDNYSSYFYENMHKLVEKGDGIILVVEKNERIIGFAAGVIKKLKTDNSESLLLKKGRVIELFVTRDERSKGYGKQLMDELEKYFKKNNCEGINIEVFAPNKSARAFYENLGYKERNLDLLKLI